MDRRFLLNLASLRLASLLARRSPAIHTAFRRSFLSTVHAIDRAVLASPRMVTGWEDSEVVIERDVGVIAGDGVRLSVDVYRPRRTGRYPAILEHIPYRKDDLRALEDRSQTASWSRQASHRAAGRPRNR